MKKIFIFLSLIIIVGCGTNTTTTNTTTFPTTNSTTTSTTTHKTTKNNNPKTVWENEFEDSLNNINIESLDQAKVFYDGQYLEDFDFEFNKKKDIKLEFVSNNHTRFVNQPNKYTITFPSKNVEFDYSISNYRISATYNNSITTISHETSNPYNNNKSGWETYYNEWVVRYIDNPLYLQNNNLEYTDEPTTYTDLLEGYEINTFSILINDNENIDYPYYNISILRKPTSFIEFYLFVTKSKDNSTEEHLSILKSFKEIESKGVPACHLGSLELKENPLWSLETQRYFEYINDESTFDFGFFRYSMPDDYDIEYRDKYINMILEDKKETQKSTEYEVEVMPTYTHISWYGNKNYFPLTAARSLAGGNGFNGLPVLQFTLQYTDNNNNVGNHNTTNNYTPVFDVLRGKYDEYFVQLANDIKAYSKPVLFRLNNEMNTDWTSYSGILSLLDPDIFKLTWIRLYDIFNQEGVDNCIWIFNPVADSCPYSSWSEDMCYFPGIDYVQALGLTKYQFLNDDIYLTFATTYGTKLYQKNKTVWANYPWIISEFGCGSGGETSGELYRNQDKQAEWVTQMFECFSNKSKYGFVKKISVAVWFNCNDVVGDGQIENALNLAPELTDTLNAFKEGFKKIKESENQNN